MVCHVFPNFIVDHSITTLKFWSIIIQVQSYHILTFIHLAIIHLVLFSLSNAFPVFIVSFFLSGIIIIFDVLIDVAALLYRYDLPPWL